MILIGSTAIKHWFPDFPREPSDRDYIGSGTRSAGTEYLLNPVFDGYQHKIMKPDDLYTLKVSHVIGWKINWEKHIYDIQFLKSKGCKLNRHVFDRLYSHWNTVFVKNQRSDLAMTADDFFDNAVDCEINHDLLHSILAPQPAYKSILVDEVEVSEDKFEALTHDEKMNVVKEECMVMSAERYKGLDYRIRYARMLKKFILNHAPLSIGIFAIENHRELVKPPFSFMNRFNQQLTNLNLKTLN